MPRQTSDKPAAKKKTAKKKAAAKSTSATRPAAKKASPAKRRAAPRGKKAGIDPVQRHQMIAVAAYFLAEKRGFAAGDPHQDWFLAESEVDELIEGNRIPAA